MFFKTLIVVLLTIPYSESLPNCKQDIPKGSLCSRGNFTDFTATPEPWPLTILPFVFISQIGEVDFHLKAITLLIELDLFWINPLISAKDVEWRKISHSEYDEFWNPTIQFENILDLQKMTIFGQEDPFSYWLYTPTQEFTFTQRVQLSFACQMEFTSFPFDTHFCNFTLGDYEYATSEGE